MKIKILLCLMLALSMVSCSNLSKNIVQENVLLLRNGTYQDKVWKEDLVFERVSWYHEWTMQLDVLMANVPPQSAFNFWFSKDELESFVKCGEARIVLAYSLDSKDIPYSMMYEQFDKNGYSHFDIPEFRKQVLQHPDSQQYGFRLYKIFAICKKDNDHKSLILNFPGYSEKIVK